MTDRTHELKIYAGQQHKHARPGEMILHLWFCGEQVMQMDLDIALRRSDVSYVDVIDCVNHTTRRCPSLPPAQCRTCGGRGEVGGFVNAESGYQTDPCPDCSAHPQAKRD